MFKFIHLWILKIKLAGIFKLAEQHSERGIEPGNEVFVALYDRATMLIFEYQHKYSGLNQAVEFPAFEDLRKLSEKPVQPPIAPKVGLAIGIFVGSAMVLGVYAGLVHLAYHLVAH